MYRNIGESRFPMCATVAALAMLFGFFALALPARAADRAFCGQQGSAAWNSVKSQLVGEWSITHLSGYAETAGMILPIPADNIPETFTIALIDGTLTGLHPQAPSPLVVEPADEPRWVAESAKGQPAPSITPDDAAVSIAGCDQLELPRVVGTSGGVVAGHRLDFTFRMIVFDASHMWGVMRVVTEANGKPVTAVRTVMLDKFS